MVLEATLEETEAGLVPTSVGWFVPSARDARWLEKLGQKDRPWADCADETAARYNASAPEDTQDGELPSARFPPPRPTRYRAGLPPDA